MTPPKANRLLPMFFLLMVMLLSIAIPTARANSEWVEAIKNNDPEKIQQLIKDGVDIHQAIDIEDENYGRITNALCLAAVYGNSEVVRLLIQKGINLGFAIDRALCEAARFGQLEIVRILIEEYNANYLPGYGGVLPLHYAASGGHANVVEYLLTLAPETANYGEGMTPLQVVFDCSYDGDNQDVIILLLEYGANPSLNGADLLNAALWMRNTGGFTLIFNHSAFNRNLINIQNDEYGNLPLHLACMNELTAVVRLILESRYFNHALINMPNCYGQTPLQLARASGNQEIMDLLIQHGAMSSAANQQDEATAMETTNPNPNPNPECPVCYHNIFFYSNHYSSCTMCKYAVCAKCNSKIASCPMCRGKLENHPIPRQIIEYEATSVEQTVTISDDSGLTTPGLTTMEQANASLSINAELDSTMEMAISETQTPLAERSRNESENTTVTLETLPSINPGMSLMNFLPPTSH